MRRLRRSSCASSHTLPIVVSSRTPGAAATKYSKMRLWNSRPASARENLNPDVDIEGILPTLVDTRTVHAKEAIELLEENFGDRVFASRITKTVRFAEAPVKGMSVLKYDPDGKAAYAYRQLAKEVLGNGKR